MLQLYKNQVVTAVAKRQVEIRKLELDWFTNNYWTLSQQGALLAGFSFAQITTALPKDTSFLLESLYLLLASMALGLQMCVVVTTTFCCMWGPGLALRGPEGIRSVHTAVDSLKSEHSYVFAFFFLGLIAFYLSNLLLVWCYFEEWIAIAASVFLCVFLFLIFYYTVSLTCKLRVADQEAVEGKIAALSSYDNIADLDETVAPTSAAVESERERAALLAQERPRSHEQLPFADSAARYSVGGTALRPGTFERIPAGPLPAAHAPEGAPVREVMRATPQGFLGALEEIFEL